MTVKKRGRAVETRRSVRIFRLPAGPGGCAIILGPKKGASKKAASVCQKDPRENENREMAFRKMAGFQKICLFEDKNRLF